MSNTIGLVLITGVITLTAAFGTQLIQVWVAHRNHEIALHDASMQRMREKCEKLNIALSQVNSAIITLLEAPEIKPDTPVGKYWIEFTNDAGSTKLETADEATTALNLERGVEKVILAYKEARQDIHLFLGYAAARLLVSDAVPKEEMQALAAKIDSEIDNLINSMRACLTELDKSSPSQHHWMTGIRPRK